MLQNLKSKSIRMKFISVFLYISKPPIRTVNMEALAVLNMDSTNQRTPNRGSSEKKTLEGMQMDTDVLADSHDLHVL